ncbi:MAG: hypothetical protein AAGI30_11660 [Planctomycetota bacterium]
MRNLWLMISLLAVTNLTALVVILGWLQATQRLNVDRVLAVRDVFTEPVPIEEAKAKIEEEEQAEAQRVADLEARVGRPPLTAGQRLAVVEEFKRVQQAELERVEEETRRLRASLVAEADAISRDRERLEADRTAFEQMRREVIEREDDAQFQQVVKQYESIPPKQGAEMMLDLVREGREMEVVGYLDAMKSRQAAKVIGQIQKQDSPLAANLLERLKVYGLMPGAEEPSNADDGV